MNNISYKSTPLTRKAQKVRSMCLKVFAAPIFVMACMGAAIADDDSSYGDGVLVQQVVDWPVRSVSLAEARAEFEI